MSHRRFSRFAWLTLAVTLVVILWGAFVRATGSGAGCGSNWPTCNGEIIPHAESVETLIEFTHRVTSGVALLMVLALGIWARRDFEVGHPVRRAAALTVIFMLSEAAIGAGIVIFELVDDNDSIARAISMAVHLGNTFLLLAALTLTAYWAEGHPPLSFTGHGKRLRLTLMTLAGMLLVGVSGAVAALGDTLYPANSLGEAIRQDLSPTSHILIQLRITHPLIAVGVSLLMLYFIGIVRKDPRRRSVRRYANPLNLLIFVQLMAGAVNVILLAPVWMQIVHLLLADFVWILLVLTSAAGLAKVEDEAPRATVASSSRQPATVGA